MKDLERWKKENNCRVNDWVRENQSMIGRVQGMRVHRDWGERRHWTTEWREVWRIAWENQNNGKNRREEWHRQWRLKRILKTSPQELCVILGKEGNGLSFPSSPASPANPVNVGDGASWEVVVDNQIDALKVHSTTQQLGADQDPRWSFITNNGSKVRRLKKG